MKIMQNIKYKGKISILDNSELEKIGNKTKIYKMKKYNDINQTKKSKKILIKLRNNYLLFVLFKIFLVLILFIPIFSGSISLTIGDSKYTSYRIYSGPTPSEIYYSGRKINCSYVRIYDSNQYYYSYNFGNHICIYKNETCDSVTLFFNDTVTYASSWFKNSEIISINFGSFSDLNYISDLNRMFYSCTSLTTVNNFRASNVQDMSYLFYDCNKLSYLSFSYSYNYNKIKYMNYMLVNCES